MVHALLQKLREMNDAIADGTTLLVDKLSPTFKSVIASGAGIRSSHPTSPSGYDTGAGGTVSQITSKATGVTINKVCGRISTFNDTLAAGAEVSFVVLCSACKVTDVPVIVIGSGPATAGTYAVSISGVSAGSFTVTLTNLSAGALSEAIILNYFIHNAVTS